MADNVAITAGSGTTIAADDIGGGVLVQRVKTTWGPDGTANDTDVATGKPFPVQFRVSDGTALTYGSGAVASGTLRVCNATDDPIVSAIQGTVAHDDPDAGNGSKIAAKAETQLAGITLVADSDRTNLYADSDGVLAVKLNAMGGDAVSGNASNTDGTSTEVIAAGAAGVKHCITDVTITNTSNSFAYVELKDGASTKWTFPVPAQSGVCKTFATPLRGTAATAWNFDPSAATTTIYCSVSGFKSKV